MLCYCSVVFFFQWKEELLAVNLGNACGVITICIALAFLAERSPSQAALDKIIFGAAHPMRVIRMRLDLDPYDYEGVDLYEMLDCLQVFRSGFERAEFKLLFPKATLEMIGTYHRLDMDYELDWYGVFKPSIERLLKKSERLACWIYFEGHIVTGCFSTQVNSTTHSYDSYDSLNSCDSVCLI